jgi:hypothetical protein
MTDFMFSIELKKLFNSTMVEVSENDFEFLLEQAALMSSVEREYFLEVLERLVGIVQ